MSVDHHTRLDVHDLLARYCHAMDHGELRDWRDLFLPNATIECGSGVVLSGFDQIGDLPLCVQRASHGQVRHLITAVVIDRGATWRDLNVSAYGPVLDLQHGGAIGGFYDYVFELRFGTRWRIRSVRATQIGATAPGVELIGRDRLAATAALN